MSTKLEAAATEIGAGEIAIADKVEDNEVSFVMSELTPEELGQVSGGASPKLFLY
jgi:hypothetical protein